MRLLHKVLHGLVVAKNVVDLFIVCRVVFVVGWRLIDRCRIDSRDPQIPEVIQLVRHALQIAAIEIMMTDTALVFPFLCIPGVQRCIPVAEPVWKDLIPDCLVHPPGHFIDIDRIHPWHGKALSAPPFDLHLFLTDKAILKIIPPLRVRHQFKIILQPFESRPDRCRPPKLVFQPFSEWYVCLVASPLLSAAQDPVRKRISIDDIHFPDIISGFEIDDQLILIKHITVIIDGSVIN